MIIVDFILWWYGPGWFLRLKSLASQLNHWGQYFSLGTILKTMFAPWHQIVTPKGPDRPLNKIIADLIDNFISRFVGFWVRLFVLIAGVFTLIFLAILNIIYLFVWPLIPLLPAVFLFVGAA